MTIFLFTFFFLLIIICGMAIGVIFKGKPIKGSCGGLNAVGIEGKCEICGVDTKKEDGSAINSTDKKDTAFYNASKETT